ncbi:unnamed protein product [Staurois parvus]|uniref:Uncharacterized protein n=1 Tax=Staurois parvus TaxID=386267 RepID=A0ABN9HHA2_9NEOB|nr:unnamed protein product [Staurois parvus]
MQSVFHVFEWTRYTSAVSSRFCVEETMVERAPHYAHDGIHSEYNQKRQVIATHTALSASALSIPLKMSKIVNFFYYFSGHSGSSPDVIFKKCF